MQLLQFYTLIMRDLVLGGGMLSPPINVIQYHFSDTFAMFLVEKFLNPLHKVILKCAFDELMQNIRCKHYVYVSVGEIVRERLNSSKVNISNVHARDVTYY